MVRRPVARVRSDSLSKPAALCGAAQSRDRAPHVITRPSNRALGLACFMGGLATTCVLVAMARAALEYAFPVNAGVGPLHAFVQLPMYLLVSAMVALAVFVFARVGRRPAMSVRQNVLVGAACGLASALQLVTPWAAAIPALLATTGVAFGLAVFLRTRMGAGGGA